MDSSVSPKDEIWFLRVCHHISTGLYSKRLAARRTLVVCEVIMVVLSPVVLPEEDLDAMPRGLHGICVVPGVRIDEVDTVVDSAVQETLIVEIAVCTPAVTDDRSAWFDPGMYDCRQCVGGSFRLREQIMFCRTLVQHRQTPTHSQPLQHMQGLGRLKKSPPTISILGLSRFQSSNTARFVSVSHFQGSFFEFL